MFYVATVGAGGLAWRFYIDAAVYRAGGQFVLDGAQLYHEQLFVGGEETGFPQTSLPFTYPPFASLLFVPLALVSQTVAGLAIAAGNLVLAWSVTALLIDAVASARWRGRRSAALATAVLPLVLLALAMAGIISLDTLKKQRPLVLVIILILAAFLTPPDVISQLMLGVPTYLLFELTLLTGKFLIKKSP